MKLLHAACLVALLALFIYKGIPKMDAYIQGAIEQQKKDTREAAWLYKEGVR